MDTWEEETKEEGSKKESNQEMLAPSMEEIVEPKEEDVLRAWEEFREKLPPEDCPYWEE